MARPHKKELFYFTLDVAFYRDIKIRMLLRYSGGPSALGVLIAIFSRIYESGYYLEWNNEQCFTISTDIFSEDRYVAEIVEKCLEYGIFDKKLYEEHHILTSHDIQERYLNATIRRTEKPTKYIYNDLIKKPKMHTETELLHTETELLHTETELLHTETELLHTESTQRKEKKRKVKHSSSAETRARKEEKAEELVDEEQQEIGNGAADEVADEEDTKYTAMLVAEVDAEINALLTDAEWKKQVFERFKFLNYDEKTLQDILLRWAGEVKMRNRGHTDLTDAKEHFKNWLVIQEDKFNPNLNKNGTDNNNGYRSSEEIYEGAASIIRKLRTEGTAKYTTPLPEV